MTTISATNARNNFYDLIDTVSASGKVVGITKNGEAKVLLVSQEEWDAMVATMETLADPELMDAIREGDEDIKAGRYTTWEDVKKEMGLGNVQNRVNKQSKKRSKNSR